MSQRRQIPIGEDGEMLVHEDDIYEGNATGLLDIASLTVDDDMAETMADVRRAKACLLYTSPSPRD